MSRGEKGDLWDTPLPLTRSQVLFNIGEVGTYSRQDSSHTGRDKGRDGPRSCRATHPFPLGAHL